MAGLRKAVLCHRCPNIGDFTVAEIEIKDNSGFVEFFDELKCNNCGATQIEGPKKQTVRY